MKKKLLSAAIASALLLSAGVANAVLNVTVDVAGSQKVANETTDAALTQQVHTLANDVEVTVGAPSDTVATTGEIRLVLSNGATWNRAPVVTVTPPTGTLALGAGTVSADGKTVTFPITTAATASDKITIDIAGAPSAAGLFNILNVPAGASVTMETQAYDNATGSFSANGVTSSNIFTKVDLATLSATENSATVNIAEVTATPVFSKIDGTTTAITQCSAALTTLTNNTTSQTLLQTDAKFTLKGDFTDVIAISTPLGTTAWTINPAQNEATANLASNLLANTTTPNLCPSLTFSGTQAIDAQKYTLSAETLATTGFNASVLATNADLISITQNGSSFSTNSTGPLNSLKITDLSGRSLSNIIITAYDATGAVVPSTAAVVMPATVAADATTVISGADLLANYPTGVRFDFVVQSAQIEVSNVKKTASGTNVTVYRNVIDTTAGQI